MESTKDLGPCYVCGEARTDAVAGDCRRCRFTDVSGQRIRPRCEVCGRFVSETYAMRWPGLPSWKSPPPHACLRCEETPTVN